MPVAVAGGGFTLIELLVVILIILLVSAVALPVVLPALAHRQVSEAARMLQGALAGARDSALHGRHAPSGIRLLPDPAFPLVYMANGQIDPTQPLAANRIIPIEAAPEYTEGMLAARRHRLLATLSTFLTRRSMAGEITRFANNSVTGSPNRTANVLMVKEIAVRQRWQPLNEPTSWFWNIRVGDKLQINGSGLWYTVVGPMVVTPQQGNTELFVNVGPAGTQSPLADLQGSVANRSRCRRSSCSWSTGSTTTRTAGSMKGMTGSTTIAVRKLPTAGRISRTRSVEWENEAWPATVSTSGIDVSQAYTIQRRPAPAANSREISLPTNVVIDMTTWGNPARMDLRSGRSFRRG